MKPEPTLQGDELPPGATLCAGQYTIEGYLNAGGFGVTYLACDSLGRRVVIKECFPSAMCFRSHQTVCVRSQGNAVEFDAILELFEKEARALAMLQNPYVVGVHQYFRDNGTAYMAMDFVEGRTLLDIIETTPDRLTPELVKSLLSQLLQALDYIHENDILHRDISPDNILVDDDDLPVLIDFGAAREDATRVSRVLSKLQTVKDGYSPQEFYVAGSDQTYASDLYALAATFFHLLTGTAPPSSQVRMAAAARDVADPLPPQPHIDGYDADFITAIWQCLSLFPKDRLPDADTWLSMIDDTRRKERLLEQAEQDETLDMTVSQLVRDFFRDFTPKASEPPKPANDPPKPVVAKPEVRVVQPEPPIDDGGTFPPAEVATAHPNWPRKPKLQPIERMQLRHSRPEVLNRNAPAEAASGRPSWLSLFGKASKTSPRAVDGDDQTEEIA
ncbi:serine/threonine-protein kinase [Gymnodinialimonas hymeniacidonis]|uniref:serine/threonine-protein kinase n=1 Tax=Gymnodinialimonas hymeniacidonis TaxID=3126508 RepID=UPI0034C6C021